MEPNSADFDEKQKAFAKSVKPGDVLTLTQDAFDYRNRQGRNAVITDSDDRRIEVRWIINHQVSAVYIAHPGVGLCPFWDEIEG